MWLRRSRSLTTLWCQTTLGGRPGFGKNFRCVFPCSGMRCARGAIRDHRQKIQESLDSSIGLSSAGTDSTYAPSKVGDVERTDGKLLLPDLYYPSWMLGLWRVSSVTRSVQAPLGPELFGRSGAFEEASKELYPPSLSPTWTSPFEREVRRGIFC
jgi:hypothetical protein